jgi:hypothetical protein
VRSKGARYFLLPEHAFWWLDHYVGLRNHLENSACLVVDDKETCLIYSLDREKNT